MSTRSRKRPWRCSLDMAKIHGTWAGYRSGCPKRCCRYIASEYTMAWKARNKKLKTPDHVHGLNGYDNYACRCKTCKEAKAEQGRQRRSLR